MPKTYSCSQIVKTKWSRGTQSFITELITDQNPLLLISNTEGLIDLFEFRPSENRFTFKCCLHLIDFDSFDHSLDRAFFYKTKKGQRLIVAQAKKPKTYYVWCIDDFNRDKHYSHSIKSRFNVCLFERFNHDKSGTELCLLKSQLSPTLYNRTFILDLEWNHEKAECKDVEIPTTETIFEDSCLFHFVQARQVYGGYDYQDIGSLLHNYLPDFYGNITVADNIKHKNMIVNHNQNLKDIFTFSIPKSDNIKSISDLCIGHRDCVSLWKLTEK
jgi:hypothetical protein